jgi:hypothetical protein
MNNNLYLSLLRQDERESHTVMALTASGILAVSGEDVAILGIPLSESERDVLRQADVFFQKNAATDLTRWQARCRGKIWVCAVNDVRLVHGKVLPVKLGDRIDIGLLRFKVVTSNEVSLLRVATPVEKEALELDVAKSFDLGELANTSEWSATSDEDNLFDIVGVHVPYLDEVHPAPNSPSGSGMKASAEALEEDILARLAGEYAQVILNPDHLHQQHWGEGTFEPRYPLLSREDALPDDQGWEKDQSLEDFVSGKLTIQDILDRLGIDDFQQLEVSEPSSNEVLMLFAQDIAQGRKKQSERIPVRTRYDHHQVSLDSHYQPEEGNGSSNVQIES